MHGHLSWHPDFASLVQADADRFERLWNNLDPNVRVFDLPEAALEQILRLRTGDRPYPELEWLKLRRSRKPGLVYRSIQPAVPGAITLRDYQVEAIDAWFAHNCRGLLETATGSGKTITSLAAAIRLLKEQERLFVVVACPCGTVAVNRGGATRPGHALWSFE